MVETELPTKSWTYAVVSEKPEFTDDGRMDDRQQTPVLRQ